MKYIYYLLTFITITLSQDVVATNNTFFNSTRENSSEIISSENSFFKMKILNNRLSGVVCGARFVFLEDDGTIKQIEAQENLAAWQEDSNQIRTEETVNYFANKTESTYAITAEDFKGFEGDPTDTVWGFSLDEIITAGGPEAFFKDNIEDIKAYADMPENSIKYYGKDAALLYWFKKEFTAVKNDKEIADIDENIKNNKDKIANIDENIENNKDKIKDNKDKIANINNSMVQDLKDKPEK